MPTQDSLSKTVDIGRGHAQWSATLQHPLARLALLTLISLYLFHGGDLIRDGLHDLGLGGGRAAGIACYGLAAAGSAFTS